MIRRKEDHEFNKFIYQKYGFLNNADDSFISKAIINELKASNLR